MASKPLSTFATTYQKCSKTKRNPRELMKTLVNRAQIKQIVIQTIQEHSGRITTRWQCLTPKNSNNNNKHEKNIISSSNNYNSIKYYEHNNSSSWCFTWALAALIFLACCVGGSLQVKNGKLIFI